MIPLVKILKGLKSIGLKTRLRGMFGVELTNSLKMLRSFGSKEKNQKQILRYCSVDNYFSWLES